LISYLKKYCFLLFLFFAAGKAIGQFTISGNVYDSSKVVPVKDVIIRSTAGRITKTDSTGHYTILANTTDSIAFIYHNKTTENFSVREIKNTGNFDISLHVRINGKFKTMKEVIVYSRSYQEDSAENRDEYAKDFDYEKPGIGVTSSDYSGAPGLDLDQFIKMFQFRKNKMEASFQKRLIEEEQDKYVDYRFNKRLIHRITLLTSPDLDTFMIMYRPPFAFVRQSSLPEFYQYILDAWYQFKKDLQLQKKKEAQ
jgi:hypothetical protein